jgi:hypothetical protein
MASRISLSTVSRSSAAFFAPRVSHGLAAHRSIAFTTSVQLGLKESASANPDKDYDHHKRDSLEKQKQGKGHWKPELASDSEEAVKADRAAFGDVSKESHKMMQERTKHAANETTKAGTSTHDGGI